MSIAQHFLGHKPKDPSREDWQIIERADELDKRFSNQFLHHTFTYTHRREDMDYLPAGLRQDPNLYKDHDVEISYYLWKAPATEEPRHSIIALPGIFGSTRRFDFFAEMASKKCNVVAMEYPGRGESGNLRLPSDYSLKTYAKIVSALIEDLDPRHDITLLGISHGAKIIYQMAEMEIIHPRWKSTILGDMGPETPEGPKERRAWRNRESPHFASPTQAVQAIASFQKSLGSPLPQDWLIHDFNHSFSYDTRQKYGWAYDPNSMHGYCDEYLGTYSKWDAYKKLPGQALILAGEQSNTLEDEMISKMISMRPMDSVMKFKETGHCPELLTQDHVDHVLSWVRNPQSPVGLIIPPMSEADRTTQPLDLDTLRNQVAGDNVFALRPPGGGAKPRDPRAFAPA